ncbi:DNA-directed RNA polymerase III subunit RPC3-like isoform X3 [Centruroides sculpturatus]|uniref:DNA-directed RNA polymerase III subunit RPC3-like isoform X3 n=1 Tax=Centruroides sculpturatus TaxID=218467 RepID=UPI000C6DA388|nr:DNA-directed RNA polymerase III subunit RPC3-like isoform X3 [Centruroides sculpturatus]
MKRYLEMKQIEDLSVMLPKDAKEYTYKMLQENFITVQEIPRTPDHAPSRTFYLFHVDLVQLCRSLLDRCYKVMFNSICHREFINREHKRLLEKKQRVEAITATLQQSGADSTQIQEIQQTKAIKQTQQLLNDKDLHLELFAAYDYKYMLD